MIDVNSMNEDERNDYIFGDHFEPGRPSNRFGWLERALIDDIQTIVNVNQDARHHQTNWLHVFMSPDRRKAWIL
ncbi:MAG TPA: hypothetical protein VE130_01540 [Nitrososphaeraceae archaeon]|jgi:hypothetical protein|nr:hypothetical protein [Nitrososphaeraceae archaeon]